ncbi:MAG: hypothetical protein OEQ29_22925 [Alphaproteobacteria bacterium]|nr:hypothetical protein [Alphaproteobacteria bacterium]
MNITNKLTAAALAAGIALFGQGSTVAIAQGTGMGPSLRVVDCGGGRSVWATEGQSRIAACLGKSADRVLSQPTIRFNCVYDFAKRQRVCGKK